MIYIFVEYNLVIPWSISPQVLLKCLLLHDCVTKVPKGVVMWSVPSPLYKQVQDLSYFYTVIE